MKTLAIGGVILLIVFMAIGIYGNIRDSIACKEMGGVYSFNAHICFRKVSVIPLGGDR